jgi:hypothetical protein
LTIACAMPARRSMPPDSVFIRASALAASPTRSIARCAAPGTAVFGISLSQAMYSTNSRTVKRG